MKAFQRSFVVDAPLDKVATFHQDPRALTLLTPWPIKVELYRAEPLTEGSVTEFALKFAGFKVQWVAEHQEVVPEAGFVDVQKRGPFKVWEHRHRFEASGKTRTRVWDEIRLEFKTSGWERVVGRVMVLGLPFLFSYRAWATRRGVGKLNA